MLGEDGRIYLIDFGRSKAIPPGSDQDVYGNEIENAYYTPDDYLIPYLSSLTLRTRDSADATFRNRVNKLKSKANLDLLS